MTDLDDLEAQLLALHGEEDAASDVTAPAGSSGSGVFSPSPSKRNLSHSNSTERFDPGAIFGEESGLTPEVQRKSEQTPFLKKLDSVGKKKDSGGDGEKAAVRPSPSGKKKEKPKPEKTSPKKTTTTPPGKSSVKAKPERKDAKDSGGGAKRKAAGPPPARRRRRISSTTTSDEDQGTETTTARPVRPRLVDEEEEEEEDGGSGSEQGSPSSRQQQQHQPQRYVPNDFAASCVLDRQKKAARAGFANAAAAGAGTGAAGHDGQHRKGRWMCCFCRRGSHFAGLGDLFGPHIIPKKYRSRCGHAELAGGEEIWFHLACVYWAPGIYVSPGVGTDVPQGLLEFMESSLSKLCISCGEPGASVACLAKQCHRVYHLPCAYAADCDLNDETLQLFCRTHKNSGAENGSKSLLALPSFMDGSLWKLRF